MTRSHDLFQSACQHIPGGVNSPVRAFKGVGGDPVFFTRGEGPWLYDADDKRYIDYVASWGPMIAGHAHPEIIAAVNAAAGRGLSFGAPCPAEVEMAERLCALVPAMDMVRMVNSGTEATMSAIRVARAATGRDLVIKFEGCYHGHADSFLVKAGSGALTLGVPNSPGVPSVVADLTVTLPYNDLDAVSACLEERGDEIAAIIVEPVAGNMNCIPPLDGYLEGLRSACSQHGCLLVASSTELGGSTPGFKDFGIAYRDAVRGFTRRLVERAGGSDELIAQRTELLVTWMLGLDVTARGAGDEAEIDRIIDAMHATVDTWSTT